MPSRLARGQLLSSTEIEQVLVIGENDNRVRVPFEVVSPCLESTDDGKEFSIVDLVVSFCRVERLGKVGAWVVVSIFISLEENCSSCNKGCISR